MKLYFYPDKGVPNLMFETDSDFVPNAGDRVSINDICYIITKRAFHYDNTHINWCVLFVDNVGEKLELEKIKI